MNSAKVRINIKFCVKLEQRSGEIIAALQKKKNYGGNMPKKSAVYNGF